MWLSAYSEPRGHGSHPFMWPHKMLFRTMISSDISFAKHAVFNQQFIGMKSFMLESQKLVVTVDFTKIALPHNSRNIFEALVPASIM